MAEIHKNTYTISSSGRIPSSTSTTNFWIETDFIGDENTKVSLTRCQIPDTLVNNPDPKILAFDVIYPEPDTEKNRSYSVVIPRGKYTIKSLTNYIYRNLPMGYNVHFDEITCRFQILCTLTYGDTPRGDTPRGVITLNEKSNVDSLMGFVYDPKITSKDGVLEAKNPSSLLDPVIFSILLGDNNVETTGILYVDPNHEIRHDHTFAIPAKLSEGLWTYESNDGPKTQFYTRTHHITLFCNGQVADLSGYNWSFELTTYKKIE